MKPYIQRTLDYACVEYPVCVFSMHDRNLFTTNDEGGK
jgi:hypothetical protein